MTIIDEHALEEIPKIDVKEATYTEPWRFYSNVHTRIEPVTHDDFRNYLLKLQNAGFTLLYDFKYGIENYKYNAVLKKEDRFVYLMNIPKHKRLFLSCGLDPYLHTWTGEDVFANLPSIPGHRSEFYEPQDYGVGHYGVELDCMTKDDYLAYLSELEALGFQRVAVNETGVGRSVFCANHVKDHLYTSVIYIEKMKKMYVSGCFDQPFSDHLNYQTSYLDGNEVSAKTTLHMLKLNEGGNCFIWKLKNGHFVISDGGLPNDTDILFKYLEKEAPNGEKPIVEGWFITHGHGDHCGIFERIAEQPEKYKGRIFVEGIYYNEPNALVMALNGGTCKGSTVLIKDAQQSLITTKGDTPKIYRTQTGQRYYFNDIYVDIVVGQEQIPFKHYSGDLNDSSTWCMFCVEGQKCLMGGDGDIGGMKFIMCAYDQSYMKMEMFTLLHHGWNTKDYFTDFCQIRTILFPCLGCQECKLPELREKENSYLKSKVEEWFSWEDGTKVMEFPYQVGSYKSI